MKCVRILFAIIIANTCICNHMSAINEDTPGLSFETGFPEDFSENELGVWKRYIGFYGANDFGAEQITNSISNYFFYSTRTPKPTATTGQAGDPDKDGWIRYGQAKYETIILGDRDATEGKTLRLDYRNTYTKYDIITGNSLGTVTYVPGQTQNLPRYYDWNGKTYQRDKTWDYTYTYPTETVKFPKGTFDIIDTRNLDPIIKDTNTCKNDYPLYTMPPTDHLEQNQKVVRIGSTGDTEMLYSSDGPFGYIRRAMAERMSYSFVVTENSTLLSYQYATFLEDPIDGASGSSGQDDAHVADERPSTFLSVTLKNKDGEIMKPVCSEFEVNMNASQAQFTSLNKSCSNTGGYAAYKDWTKYVYDLRDHIGDTVTINVWIHDCLLELPVCENCGTVHPNTDFYRDEDGIPRIKQCINKGTFSNGDYICLAGCGRKNARCRMVPMAGGHIAYCYFTAFTKKMEMIVDNCPENDYITLTAPTGFSNYVWKAGLESLTTVEGQPNVAKVLRAAIQENVDYTCTMSGDDEACSKIVGTVQLNKDPLGAKFTKKITCDNDVKFTNNSYVTPMKYENEYIDQDTITKYTWTTIETETGRTAYTLELTRLGLNKWRISDENGTREKSLENIKI